MMLGFFIQREMQSLWRSRAVLIQLWILPVLVLFVAGLLLPASMVNASVLRLLDVMLLLMVTLAVTARQWHDDLHDGVLEQIYLARQSLIMPVITRFSTMMLGVYWPVIIISMLARAVWFAETPALLVVMASLWLAVIMAALSLLVAALTVSLSRGALLVALLLIPFLVPAFIGFMVATTQTDMAGAALWLLAALAVFITPLACLATASVLRQQLST